MALHPMPYIESSYINASTGSQKGFDDDDILLCLLLLIMIRSSLRRRSSFFMMELFSATTTCLKVTILGLVADQVRGDTISIGDVGVAANLGRFLEWQSSRVADLMVSG
jgi:hypothetical protein